MKAYEEWKIKPFQGIGVSHFSEYTPSNSFIFDKKILSGSEWTQAIKMNINYANLAGVPGVNSGSNMPNLLCRHCGKEREILSHVLGSCPHNNTMVIARHNKIKNKISEELNKKGYDCFEEVHAIDNHGSHRFCDIIAFERNTNKAFIIDPTIRFEKNDALQGDDIHREKCEIYNGCIPYLKEKYLESYGERDFQVLGLWFGSRGTISKNVFFFDKFHLPKNLLKILSQTIICDSVKIVNFHIYSNS